MEQMSPKMQEEYQAYLKERKAGGKKNGKKIFLIVLAAILGAATLFGIIAGIIVVALNGVKASEEYRVAYTYLIQSEAFDDMGATPEDVRFSSFSTTSYLTETEEGYKTTAELTFYVKGEKAIVICHKFDDKWSVCEECTAFG